VDVGARHDFSGRHANSRPVLENGLAFSDIAERYFVSSRNLLNDSDRYRRFFPLYRYSFPFSQKPKRYRHVVHVGDPMGRYLVVFHRNYTPV
jgi:hypothetical protein